MTYHPLAFSLGLAFVFLCTQVYDRLLRRSRLPPGPSGHFLFGSLNEFRTSQRWEIFTGWSKLYGDVVHTTVLGRSFIVVNSVEAANDILVKRSLATSGRPRFVMACELMGFDSAVALSQPNSFHRRMRRLMVPELSVRNSANREPVELEERNLLLQRLERSPEAFEQHIERAVASVVLGYSYAHHVTEDDDPLVQTIKKSMAMLSGPLAGNYLVDSIPPLKYIPEWFPGAAFKAYARKAAVLRKQTIDAPFLEVKRKMESGIAEPSFLQSLLQQRSSPDDWDSEQVEIMKCAAGSLYSAGSDTTISALITFFLTMVLNPEKQRIAQQELDAVLGQGRLPGFQDQGSLPYTNALVSEVLRWYPVLPLGLPHTSTENIVHKQYIIPKGATIVSNIWAMSRDTRSYPNPEQFLPERFLPKPLGGLHATPAPDPAGFVFGFGRRACPGKHLAVENLWILAASILATFDILPHVDVTTGQPVIPPGTYGGASFVRPHSFKCTVKKRMFATSVSA